MTNPTNPPKSPPRRARPRVPDTYLSSTFSPAHHALGLVAEPSDKREQTLQQLRSLRHQISEYLHEEAPQWSHLTTSLSQLTHALRTTQSATNLRTALASLSTNHDYPARMSAVVARTARLSATVSLASSTRCFAELLQTVKTVPPGTMPKRFLPHTTALHRARTAANTSPLADVEALNDIRSDLDTRHANLLSSLQRALVAGIFSGTLPFDRHDSLSHSLSTPPNISLRTNSISTVPPPASVCPDLARAIDMLAKPGAAAQLLAESARSKISALIRDAVLSESTPPARTVASLTSSSFTAAATNSPTSFGSGHVFRDPSTKRVACAAVFERVKFLMTGVLRRLSALAEAVRDDMKDISAVVHPVWEIMEDVLVMFVKALLDFPSGNKRTKGDESRGISLLPLSHRPGDADSVPAWEVGRGQSSLDSFASLVSSMPSLAPSIYNLEVVYSPLQMFVMNTNRMQESWNDKAPAQAESSALLQLLNNAVERFLKLVRDDVKRFMNDAFGNRAGTLLQPLSLRQKGSNLSKGTHSLPPLPQAQAITEVMAACLSLAVAVPSVASKLGEVINNEIVIPLSERAIYALKLAESWTEAGMLLAEIEKTAKQGLVIESVEVAHDKPLSGELDSPSGRLGAFKTIQDGPETTTRCLATMFERRKQVVGKGIQLLTESEWNAVVRLLVTTRFVMDELESCIAGNADSQSGSPVGVSGFTAEAPEQKRSGTLRALLQERGISSGLHTAIVEAIQSTKPGCRVLRQQVVDRGLALLHAEITLHCFSEVVQALSSEAQDPCRTQESSGSLQSVEDVHGHAKCDATGLAMPSSIFKASQIQLHDNAVEEDDGFPHAMNEYDEFGDLIATVTENVTDADIEEYGFPNSLLLEQVDWKSPSKDYTEEKTVAPLISPERHQVITRTDQKVVDNGLECGEQLKQRELCIEDNLSEVDRDFVFCQTDAGVGLGIRYIGNVNGRGDRDVATRARLFLDAVAGLAADTMGWYVVESDYSVTEGASHSASECRALLYSAGLL